jgi:hypothetical protein
MTKEKIDYKRVIELLRKSKPSFPQQGLSEEYILRQIEEKGRRRNRMSILTESLFGWVYIPLVRRILVTASVIMVGIFIFQQYVLINQVRNINRQVIVLKNETESAIVPDVGSGLMLYRLSDRFRSGGNIKISGRELEKIIEAYNELDGKYQDLLKIVNENPQLREFVEKKLEEGRKDKPNL